MWVSGSLISSSTCRSSSVSAPSMTRSIFLPSSCARSRTTRGSLFQALPIGCIRVFITPSCRSEVICDSRCSGTAKVLFSCVRASCRSWLRVSTSSLTRVMRSSSTSTPTRMVCAAPTGAAAAAGAASVPARGPAPAAGSAASAGASGITASGVPDTTASGVPDTAASGVDDTTASGVDDTTASGSGAAAAGATIGAKVATADGSARAGAGVSPSAARSRAAIRGPSSPACSVPVAARSATMSLIRSSASSTRLTRTGVGRRLPSRIRLSTFSPACATFSSRGRPRKPQVPLIVCTRRKMPDRVSPSSGVVSSRTSATSSSAMFSFVSVRNSASRSSIARPH